MARDSFSHNACMANIREQIKTLELVNYILSEYIENNCSYDVAGLKALHNELCKRIFQNSSYLENTFGISNYPETRGFNHAQAEYGLLLERIKNRSFSTKSKPQINYKAFER